MVHRGIVVAVVAAVIVVVIVIRHLGFTCIALLLFVCGLLKVIGLFVRTIGQAFGLRSLSSCSICRKDLLRSEFKGYGGGISSSVISRRHMKL